MTAEAFLEELQRLIRSHPKTPLHHLNCEECDTSDYVYNSKNLYNCFDAASCVDSSYLFDSFMCVNCADCDYTVEAELCYESVDAYKAYNCNYVDSCPRTRDSSYCYDCWDCNNVFGCTNLRNKSFCIFNRQLTKEEYHKEVKKYESNPPEKVLAMLEELKLKYPVTQTNEGHNENTNYGNYIYDNKNCYLCFDAARNEDCAYLYNSFDNKVSMDITYGAYCELNYQVVDGGYMFNSNFSVYSSNCQESSYLFNCFNVKNSLGCVGIKHKEYCLLNRQLNKEEYEKESAKILLDFKEKSIDWGSLAF